MNSANLRQKNSEIFALQWTEKDNNGGGDAIIRGGIISYSVISMTSNFLLHHRHKKHNMP